MILETFDYKVIPFTQQKGRVQAPAIYVENQPNPRKAIEQAKTKTNLSRFPNWKFYAVRL